jgi:glutamyl-tRNA reductase
VDVGLPRSVDPAAGGIANVSLLNLDDLRDVVDGNLLRRGEEAEKASAIVESEVDEALRWMEARKNSTLIQALWEHMESIRARELHRVRLDGSLTEEEKLERLSTHILKKITQPLLRKINDTRAGGDGKAFEAYLEMLKDVFGIS